METEQLADFSQQLLSDACRFWQLSNPEKISDAENLIFKCKASAGEIALRLTHPDHRTASEIQAELEWITYLRERGISVVEPATSQEGHLLHTIDAGRNRWHACAFRWIDGGSIAPRGKPVPIDSIQKWGELTGKIVAASIKANRENITFARYHWNESVPHRPAVAEKVAGALPVLAEELQLAIQDVETLPAGPSEYGLIHTDLHSGNVFQNPRGDVVALDFDDSCYHYFLQELAMPIYYDLLFREEETQTAAREFLAAFLPAYRKFHDIESKRFDDLPLFFRLRDLDLQAITHLWKIPEDSRWGQRFKRLAREGNPLCDYPWSDWAEQLS